MRVFVGRVRGDGAEHGQDRGELGSFGGGGGVEGDVQDRGCVDDAVDQFLVVCGWGGENSWVSDDVVVSLADVCPPVWKDSEGRG
jgi:hypothetical protein